MSQYASCSVIVNRFLNVDYEERRDWSAYIAPNKRRDRRSSVSLNLQLHTAPDRTTPNTFDSALTDALISGIAKGSEAYKLVGSYVTTPLNWSASPFALAYARFFYWF
jgi:hypothetical protein